MARVTVVIPAFNMERYVEIAVKSALAQTYRDIEVVIVDDGSTDATPQIIESFGNRVRVITQENRGLSAARNVAIGKATGEFVALLDADDYWPSHRIETMMDFLDSHPQFGLVTTDSFVVVEQRETTQTTYGSLSPKWRFRSTEQGYWITQYNFMQIHTVIRQEALDLVGWFDESLHACEDWDLWIRMLRKGVAAGLVDQPLAFYRLRQGSLSLDRVALIPHELKVLKKALGAAGADAPGLAGRIHFGEAKLALSHGNSSLARQHFASAAADNQLNSSMRTKAMMARLAPGAAWHLYRAIRTDRKMGG